MTARTGTGRSARPGDLRAGDPAAPPNKGVRHHIVFLGTSLILSFALSSARGLLGRGNVLPASQEFAVSAMYGLLVALASWLGYAGLLVCLERLSFDRARIRLAWPSAISAAIPVALVYSGWFPRLMQMLRRLLGLHVPRLLAVLVVLPVACFATTALVFVATRQWYRLRGRLPDG